MPVASAAFQKNERFLSGHFGHILVEDDHIRKLSVGRLLQLRDHFQAVLRKNQLDVRISRVQQIREDQPVVNIIINQENLLVLHSVSIFEASGWRIGRTQSNRAPFPSLLDAMMRPLWRSMIFFVIARPIPVPSNLSLGWRRWKSLKIFSANFSSKPMPLSVRVKCKYSPAGSWTLSNDFSRTRITSRVIRGGVP